MSVCRLEIADNYSQFRSCNEKSMYSAIKGKIYFSHVVSKIVIDVVQLNGEPHPAILSCHGQEEYDSSLEIWIQGDHIAIAKRGKQGGPMILHSALNLKDCYVPIGEENGLKLMIRLPAQKGTKGMTIQTLLEQKLGKISNDENIKRLQNCFHENKVLLHAVKLKASFYGQNNEEITVHISKPILNKVSDFTAPFGKFTLLQDEICAKGGRIFFIVDHPIKDQNLRAHIICNCTGENIDVEAVTHGGKLGYIDIPSIHPGTFTVNLIRQFQGEECSKASHLLRIRSNCICLCKFKVVDKKKTFGKKRPCPGNQSRQHWDYHDKDMNEQPSKALHVNLCSIPEEHDNNQMINFDFIQESVDTNFAESSNAQYMQTNTMITVNHEQPLDFINVSTLQQYQGSESFLNSSVSLSSQPEQLFTPNQMAINNFDTDLFDTDHPRPRRKSSNDPCHKNEQSEMNASSSIEGLMRCSCSLFAQSMLFAVVSALLWHIFIYKCI